MKKLPCNKQVCSFMVVVSAENIVSTYIYIFFPGFLIFYQLDQTRRVSFQGRGLVISVERFGSGSVVVGHMRISEGVRVG